MASTKRTTTSRAQGSRASAPGSQNRASLPPKPGVQKRTRNGMASAGMPPTPQSSEAGRPRAQRVWGRRSASWTAEEDARLVELVKKESASPPSITASKTWSRVATQLTNRTGKQCRERYLNQLKPGIRRDPWSPEEERILREAHARIGNKWVAIANQLPGRTDNCVKNHWNSMLRKRMRREAALKAAQEQVVATLGKSQPPRLEGDRRSEAEYSVHTGCATPSGASTSYHDFQTSGIPSPYTALSPITPKRDSKLQISTLVAASTKEQTTWNIPRFPKDAPRLGSPYVSAKDETRNGSSDVMTVSNPKPANHHLPQIAPPVQTLPCAFVQHPANLGIARDANTHLVDGRMFAANSHFLSKNVSPMQCIASSSRVPQLLQSGHSDGKAIVDSARQVRRSSRLISSSTKDRSGVPSVDEPLRGVPHRTISKVKRMDEGVGTNALAALAAAASSVPPSPLTPESRFSATSRSRSVSPNPRLWPAQKQCGAGSSGVDVTGMGRETSGRREMLNEGGVSGSEKGGVGSMGGP